MSCLKLLLILFCVNVSRQANETQFKPLDGRVVPIVSEYLKKQETTPFSDWVSKVEEFFGEDAIRQREAQITDLVRRFLRKYDNYNLTRGIELKRIDPVEDNAIDSEDVLGDIVSYAKRHVIKVHFSELLEDASEKAKRSTEQFAGRCEYIRGGQAPNKNAFLTGFGLGFLAFGLKKLMLPFMIGAQIVKSVLIAMFLPSIIGGIGRLVGKGVTGFASASNGFGQPYGQANNMMHGQMEDFDFKGSYESQQYPDAQQEGSSSVFSYAYPNNQDFKMQQSVGVLPGHAQGLANRFTSNSHRVTYMPNNNHHGSFYTKHHDKKHQNYKIFHNIPSSSLLLTNYDPFYSPLLSRMDSVFKQLGYETEGCRERLICLMYKNPAKFAPYSNLISAQLSRELNELRKPTTDNPDILRFFKYMKAAKDGQDGLDCIRAYSACFDSRESISPPMVKTYNEINKLVHARKLFK
ncbi:UNVERIFIED_CONTAM: hypothetical protein PYX00_004775 [Menopon gallinae]|uniref:Uncharacterized protein n=1 Tax=Menopon gallinae TaxID=328185 RepID=A0AAW2I5X8_9NEOP